MDLGSSEFNPILRKVNVFSLPVVKEKRGREVQIDEDEPSKKLKPLLTGAYTQTHTCTGRYVPYRSSS